MADTEADDYQLYLTTDDKSNFRYDIATIRPYKGNRNTDKPHWYTHIRDFLVDHRGAIEVSGQEADDAMSIAQYTFLEEVDEYDMRAGKLRGKYVNATVICSKDKDLLMVPGYHYNWAKPEEGVWCQDELSGLRCFYKQLLTGDTVDNIPGLFGVGVSSKLLTKLDDMHNESDMYAHVFEQYEKRFGSYAEQFIIENGRLLWMRKKEGEMWNPPCTTGT